MQAYVTTPAGTYEIDDVETHKQVGPAIELHKKFIAAGKPTLIAIVGIAAGVLVTFGAAPKKVA